MIQDCVNTTQWNSGWVSSHPALSFSRTLAQTGEQSRAELPAHQPCHYDSGLSALFLNTVIRRASEHYSGLTDKQKLPLSAAFRCKVAAAAEGLQRKMRWNRSSFQSWGEDLISSSVHLKVLGFLICYWSLYSASQWRCVALLHCRSVLFGLLEQFVLKRNIRFFFKCKSYGCITY